MHELATVRRDRTGWSEDKILGDELRIAREVLNLSQTDLGERIGLTRQQVGQVEKGKRKLEWLEFQKWAAAVGQTTDSLYAMVQQESRNRRHGSP